MAATFANDGNVECAACVMVKEVSERAEENDKHRLLHRYYQGLIRLFETAPHSRGCEHRADPDTKPNSERKTTCK